MPLQIWASSLTKTKIFHSRPARTETRDILDTVYSDDGAEADIPSEAQVAPLVSVFDSFENDFRSAGIESEYDLFSVIEAGGPSVLSDMGIPQKAVAACRNARLDFSGSKPVFSAYLELDKDAEKGTEKLEVALYHGAKDADCYPFADIMLEAGQKDADPEKLDAKIHGVLRDCLDEFIGAVKEGKERKTRESLDDKESGHCRCEIIVQRDNYL